MRPETRSRSTVGRHAPVMAHVVGSYLKGTATFIYQYLTHMQRYTPIVLATFRHHPERFPIPDLYVANLSSAEALFVRAYRRLFYRQPLVEPFFRKVIQDRNVELLHAHFGPVGVFALPVCASPGAVGARLPLVTTFYGFDMSAMPKKAAWWKNYQKLFQEGDLFLVEGPHMREQLIGLGCPRSKVQIQRIGVNLDAFAYRATPPIDDQVRILMVGRFTEKKGFEYGIRAFSKILAEFPRAQLRIVGGGERRRRMEQLVQQLRLEQKVLMLGMLPYDEYAKEAANAHLFLAPSVTAADGDSEGGAPTVLLEMQARGLPIVSTTHADIPEVVQHGASGFLVPERDEAALAEKLIELLSHPEKWDAMGRAGRAHVESCHNIVVLAQELEKKYDALRAA